MKKQTLGIALFGIFLAACAQPNALQPPAVPVTETEEIIVVTNTAEPEPTQTLEPTDSPTETPTSAPPTVTLEPSDLPEPTAIPLETFETNVDIQAQLTLYSEEPVISRENGNRYLNGGAIIFHDDQFHMFSNFFNSWPGATTSYYYTSPDGREWTRQIEEPLFTVDDVPLEGTGALALSGLVQPDGTWVLYYHTFSSGSQQGWIGRATAPEPTGPWTFDEEPVLSPGSEGEWDDLHVMRVNVLPQENGEGYVMYYAGTTKGRHSAIGMATSADGIVWEKYDDPTTTEAPFAESDPIMVPQAEWEGIALGRPEVVKTADGWVMMYEGSGGGKSGFAISSDGINFKRYANNPFLTTKNMVSQFPFFQGAFFHQDDTYFYLIEAGNGVVGTDIFLYTIEGSILSD